MGNVETLHAAVERRAADAEGTGGLGGIAVGPGQRPDKGSAFGAVESSAGFLAAAGEVDERPGTQAAVAFETEAAARLARGADFCVPAACRKLAPGAEDEHSMKNLVGDLECCAPRERAGCADGYRYATRGKCTSGPCEEYATCCVHCVDGEACTRVDAARFGQTARRDCGSDDANYIRVWIVMAVMCFVASIGLLVCLFAQYHRSEQQRRLQVARGKRDTHAPARKFSLAVVELLPPDLERGATPRIQARQLDENVGETRGAVGVGPRRRPARRVRRACLPAVLDSVPVRS